MDNETKPEEKLPSIISIIIVILLIAVVSIYTVQLKNQKGGILWHPARLNSQEGVFLQDNVKLPVRWGNIGVKMVEAGVIDKEKFENLYSQRGGLSEVDKKLLGSSINGNLVINSKNSGVLLNMLWAFGLGNKNPILETGPMMDPKYGGAGNFASTGGWSLSKGNAMSHYSMHLFVTLTEEQQALVERVAKNIYRPCCGNSTYFPDCNHGMAMLGLLELMASQEVSEPEMYKTALIVNSFWFPSTYETIKVYMEERGVKWKDVNPQEILGADYSSGRGYANIASQVIQSPKQRGPGCGA